MDPADLHRALLEPASWGAGDDLAVDFTETHVSLLYFLGETVFKVKKPVDFGFLDFRSLPRRRFYCGEEVRLNARFAPGTYLRVAPLCRNGERIRLDGPGTAVEYAVVMRRLPAARMLDRLIAAGEPGLPGEMTRLGRRLAELHRTSPVPAERPGSDRERVWENWQENFRQCAGLTGVTLVPGALDRVREAVTGFLEDHRGLLDRRQVQGLVRDGHGDLHAEHICLTDPLQIYDCIEFNRRFRVADLLADLAFLLMDLEFRGRPELAAAVLAAYRGAWGDDPDASLLLPFYRLYRAWVRGKVDSFLAMDPGADPGLRRQATTLARRYFNLGLGYLVAPLLMLTCGLMGSGKSTLARTLARATGALLLRSDVLRKELAGTAAAGSGELPFGAGIYTPAFTARVYDLLLERAQAGLEEGRTVIVDASFSRAELRHTFCRAAGDRQRPTTILWARCPRTIALERLARRTRQGGDPSDGRPELWAEQAQRFEAPGAEEGTIAVDTTGDVDYTVQLILCRLADRTLAPLRSPAASGAPLRRDA